VDDPGSGDEVGRACPATRLLDDKSGIAELGQVLAHGVVVKVERLGELGDVDRLRRLEHVQWDTRPMGSLVGRKVVSRSPHCLNSVERTERADEIADLVDGDETCKLIMVWLPHG
jgi:hypothetical protein